MTLNRMKINLMSPERMTINGTDYDIRTIHSKRINIMSVNRMANNRLG
jgi:hypothetical protein